MITKVLQQLWNFEKLLKIMLFVYKNRTQYTGINQKRFRVEVYPGAPFCVTENHSLQERTYIR